MITDLLFGRPWVSPSRDTLVEVHGPAIFGGSRDFITSPRPIYLTAPDYKDPILHEKALKGYYQNTLAELLAEVQEWPLATRERLAEWELRLGESHLAESHLLPGLTIEQVQEVEKSGVKVSEVARQALADGSALKTRGTWTFRRPTETATTGYRILFAVAQRRAGGSFPTLGALEFHEWQSDLYTELRVALTQAISAWWKGRRESEPVCSKRGKTPVIWMRRHNEESAGGDSKTENSFGKIRAHIKGLKEGKRLLIQAGFDVEELQMEHLTFAELSTKLACPHILMGIEGAAFANALLLRQGGGTLQLSFAGKEPAELRKGIAIPVAYHSQWLQYWPDIADTQFHSEHSRLDPRHMLDLVKELDERIRHQRALPQRNQTYTYRQFQPANQILQHESGESGLCKPLQLDQPETIPLVWQKQISRSSRRNGTSGRLLGCGKYLAI